MLYYEISVPDRNDATMRVSLDGEYYYLRTTWNEYGGFWLLSIYDAEMNIIIGMAKLVPGTIWNKNCRIGISKKYAKRLGNHGIRLYHVSK